jgi:hypothetical protein
MTMTLPPRWPVASQAPRTTWEEPAAQRFAANETTRFATELTQTLDSTEISTLDLSHPSARLY